jgi:hypothetical protein
MANPAHGKAGQIGANDHQIQASSTMRSDHPSFYILIISTTSVEHHFYFNPIIFIYVYVYAFFVIIYSYLQDQRSDAAIQFLNFHVLRPRWDEWTTRFEQEPTSRHQSLQLWDCIN